MNYVILALLYCLGAIVTITIGSISLVTIYEFEKVTYGTLRGFMGGQQCAEWELLYKNNFETYNLICEPVRCDENKDECSSLCEDLLDNLHQVARQTRTYCGYYP